jgi:hypothetical protein
MPSGCQRFLLALKSGCQPFGCRSDFQITGSQSLQHVAATAVRRMNMGSGFAIDSFVPLWIFAPILLIGIVGLLTTPSPNRSQLGATRSFDVDKRDGALATKRL